MSGDTFDTYDSKSEPMVNKGSGCLAGCLIALAIGLLILLVSGWLVYRNFRGLTGWVASTAIESVIYTSPLPDIEKTELKAEVKRVTDGFSNGTITDKQMERIMEGFTSSPLISTFIVMAVEQAYFSKSGLTDEEQAAGRIALQRYAKGVVTKKIDERAVDKLMEHIANRGENGEWELQRQVTDEQLRAFLAEAKQQSDDAGIPAETEPIDPSDELKRIIDAALAAP